MLLQQSTDRFLKSLDNLECGALELVTPDGHTRVFQGRTPGIRARLETRDWRVFGNLATRGDVGFAEDYRAGLWDTCNLQNLIALGLQNDRVIGRYVFGSRLHQSLSRLTYLLRLNTLGGSRRNIHVHYDLGNDFYSLWLDPTMTYSAALYKDDRDSLEQAQINKYDRIIDHIGNSSRVLEIGCGWGGFAVRAGQRGDFTVKGITLSEEQHAFAAHRLDGDAHIALEDYRHQQGQYNAIVSIEMFEAVGERYWPVYFNKIRSLLQRDGKAMIQTITIDDSRFDRYRRGGDIIRSYIFPGGMLPSPERFRKEAEKAGLRVTDEFHFGQDYARTLETWLSNFDARRGDVTALGFDDSFIRLWRFYLASCIAGFRTGRTSVMQAEVQHA